MTDLPDYDLLFTLYPADDQIPEEAFGITSGSDRGDLWLIDNTDTTSLAAEGEELIPAGAAWVETRQEFEQLIQKATADGLSVQRDCD